MPVYLEYAEQTAIIQLDNPPVNALSAAILNELREAVQRVREQAKIGEVRVVIVTGSGPKSFVAGADITRFPELDSISGRELAREGQLIFEELELFWRKDLLSLKVLEAFGCSLTKAGQKTIYQNF